MRRKEEQPLTLGDIPVPQDLNLEAIVLSEVSDNPHLLPQVIDTFERKLFYDPRCIDIYDVVKGLYTEGEEVDLVTISQRLKDRSFYINHIMSQSSPSTDIVRVKTHLDALREVMQRRAFYFACARGIQQVSQGVPFDMMTYAQKIEEDLRKTESKDDTEDLMQAIERVEKKIKERRDKRVPTGFPTLDKLLYGGFTSGNLVILAARPSVGKTAFMLQMTQSADVPALVLSLEMTNEDLVKRLLRSTGYVQSWQMANGQIDWMMWQEAKKILSQSKVYLNEKPQSIDDVCNLITKNHNKGRCDIAFIDYLQLMGSINGGKLYEQVTDMTKRIKRLAKSLGIPIVLLCQLNRASASENRAPQLFDLRDSGSIEQDADIVLMLDRERDEEGNNTPRVNMYVRKNREGVKDMMIKCISNDNYTKFDELQ